MFALTRSRLMTAATGSLLLGAGTLSLSMSATAAPAHPAAFSASEFRSFPLIAKTELTHDTASFRFALPDGHVMGMPTASCIVVRATNAEGKAVVRPYTPVSSDATVGTFDLVIKTYPKGNVSKAVHAMKLGESLDVKGPFVKFKYEANQFKHVVMIAGGTGITPMWQVFTHALSLPEDRTKFTLIYANNSERDIIYKNEIAALERQHPDRFSVYHVLGEVPAGWKQGQGFVNKEIIAAHSPAPAAGADVKVMICGPPPMMAAVCGAKDGKDQGKLGGHLLDMGYSQEQVFKF